MVRDSKRDREMQESIRRRGDLSVFIQFTLPIYRIKENTEVLKSLRKQVKRKGLESRVPKKYRTEALDKRIAKDPFYTNRELERAIIVYEKILEAA